MEVTTTTKPITSLTPEIKNQIVELYEEKKTADEIATILNIDIETLKDLFQKERTDRLLRKAEKVSEQYLDIDLTKGDIEKKYGKNKIQVMKIIQAEAMFLRETLGKDAGYSKRNELTGKNGDAIQIKEILFHAPIPNKVL